MPDLTTAEEPRRCGEPGCSNAPDRRCDGPTGAGCAELFCDDHLYATERDGYLCSADYDCIEDRPLTTTEETPNA